jgi:hypothetical protein
LSKKFNDRETTEIVVTVLLFFANCDIRICNSCFAIHWITLRISFYVQRKSRYNHVLDIKAQIVIYAVETLMELRYDLQYFHLIYPYDALIINR